MNEGEKDFFGRHFKKCTFGAVGIIIMISVLPSFLHKPSDVALTPQQISAIVEESTVRPKAKPSSQTGDGETRSNQTMDIIDAKTMADMNLKATLQDPDSAKFKDVIVSRIPGGNLMVCGKVNAKNAFGAYTGYEKFIASPNPDAPSIIDGETSGLSKHQFMQVFSQACSNIVGRF